MYRRFERLTHGAAHELEMAFSEIVWHAGDAQPEVHMFEGSPAQLC